MANHKVKARDWKPDFLVSMNFKPPKSKNFPISNVQTNHSETETIPYLAHSTSECKDLAEFCSQSESSLTKSQATALSLGQTDEDASVESKRRGF